ncbi:PAS domain S-box protein [Echinicola sp. 20G]|uniref:PAS domain S-box protein n=1 Tax=Echinicola sp. 20G TaxID=2781961 RepID=UPI00190FF247|nr:PAS domain S-box protein [Echinicola sp. 20G]
MNPDQYIFDLSPFPMWVYDIETLQFLTINQEAINHYGYSKEEFLNMTLRDIRPEEDISIVENAVAIVRSGKKWSTNNLYRHKKKNGTIIWVQIKSNVITYKGKRAEIVSAIDLTSRYEQQKLIEEQKNYLAAISDFQEILLQTNYWPKSLRKCLKILGETLKVDHVFYVSLKAQHEDIVNIVWDNTVNGGNVGETKSIETTLAQFGIILESLKQGKSYTANLSQLPPSTIRSYLKGQNIKATFLMPIMVDKTAIGFIGIEDYKKERIWRKEEFQLFNNLIGKLTYAIKENESHRKLFESEARFKSLVQKGNDLIAIIDQTGNYKYVAPTSERVLGIPPEVFMGKNAFEYICPDDIERVGKELEKIFTEKHITIDAYRFADANGKWIWIQTELTNHLDDPAINGIVANTRVVTEEVEKRMRERIVSSMTKNIGQPGSLSFCAEHALDNLTLLDNINICELWLVSKDKSRLDLIAKSFKKDSYQTIFIKTSGRGNIDVYRKGEGIPGKIWESKHTRIFDGLSDNGNNEQNSILSNTSLSTAFGIPILYFEEFLGCLVCFSSKESKILRDQINLLEEVSPQLGGAIKQKLIEEEYRNFFELSPEPLCVVGFDGNIKKHNKALGKLLGFKKGSLLNNSILRYVSNDDDDISLRRVKDFIKGKERKSFEAKFVTKKGTVKTLVWKVQPIVSSKIYLAAAKDVTVQQHAERALRDAFLKLKTAQKIAKLGYWSRNLDTDISEWSEETYKIYGYEPDQFTPSLQNIQDAFHPEDRALIESDPMKNLEPGKVNSFEHRIIDSSKKVKWVKQEIRLVVDSQNKPVRVEGTIRDITEQKEYEQQLFISNNRFKLAMKVSSETIWEVDHVARTIIRSKEDGKKFGYKELEAFSKENSWFNYIHPEDRENVWNSFISSLNDKSTHSWKAEYRAVSPEGAIAYFIDRCHILRDNAGIPIRSVGSVLNVTESRKQLELIRNQNNKLREIAWLQSHVIRAPLSRIMSLVLLLKESKKMDISTDQLYEWIETSCKEMDHVVHEITDKANAVIDEDNFDNNHYKEI